MEELVWIVLFAIVWLASTIGEARKSRKQSPVGEKGQRARKPERRPQTGPAATRRGLASDLEEGARRAEEALRRWEARQGAPATREEPAIRGGRRQRPADRWREAGARIAGTAGEAVRREAEERRNEAYAAITDLLAEREIGAQGDLAPPRPTSPLPLAPAAAAGPAEVGVGARPASPATGLSRLDHLPPLQRAIVLRELLGPPKALSPESGLS